MGPSCSSSLDHGFGAVGGHQFRSDRRRPRNLALADQVAVPCPQEPSQPPPAPSASRQSSGVYVFTNTSVKMSPRRCTSATTFRPRGRSCGGSCSPATPILGHQATWVDYKNDSRAPLLFISGGDDHLLCRRASSGRMPSTTSRTPSPRSKSTRAGRTFSRAGRLEEVADYALEWALANANQPQRLLQIPRNAAEVV